MFKALFTNILLELIKGPTHSPGGITLPEREREFTYRGKVVQVGNSSSMKVGDVVIYKRNEGQLIEIDGKQHLLIDEWDILAVEE